jgi:hypothetical protein
MNILVQRINIPNNENRRYKITNRIISFFEINIVIWLFIWTIKSKLNICIQNLNNKNININEHRHLDKSDLFFFFF